MRKKRISIVLEIIYGIALAALCFIEYKKIDVNSIWILVLLTVSLVSLAISIYLTKFNSIAKTILIVLLFIAEVALCYKLL